MLDEISSVVITLTFNDGTKMRRKVDGEDLSETLLLELEETFEEFE
jgi:hypothetical protein